MAYAQQWFTPLSVAIKEHQSGARKPVLIAINGCQGSGKTTVCDYLRVDLEENHGLRVVSLSLDDFYLTRAQRQELARVVHPLLSTRGVPGTHDMPLLRSTLAALLAQTSDAVEIPRFDKALDDRRPGSGVEVVSGDVDVVLLEGWCLGARGQTEAELVEPVNELEACDDPDGKWRRYVNEILLREFESLYALVDLWVMLAAPSFDCVYQWRLEQEQKLASRSCGEGIMSASQLSRFIQFYERITRHCLAQLPGRSHYVYQLDQHRQVTGHQYCARPAL